jgi:hypothetical protein
MAKEYRTIRNDVALPYQWALGKTWTRFFDGLKEERIWGTQCGGCQKVYVPARPFCPVCLKDMTKWLEVAQEGKLVSWTLVDTRYHGQVKEPPYIVAMIRLRGADCDFHHYLGGVDLSDRKKLAKKLKTGTKIKPIWSSGKNGNISDVEYFALVK